MTISLVSYSALLRSPRTHDAKPLHRPRRQDPRFSRSPRRNCPSAIVAAATVDNAVLYATEELVALPPRSNQVRLVSVYHKVVIGRPCKMSASVKMNDAMSTTLLQARRL